MDRTTFEAAMGRAVRLAVDVAREYVREALPAEATLRVYPNRSYDGDPRRGDEEVFPGDSLPEGAFRRPWSMDEAVDFLWRDGKVPEWIDVAVEDVNEGRAAVALRCCGRFTSQEDLLYHRQGGLPPFSVKSPWLPPRWKDVETSGRFALRWMDRPGRRRRTLVRRLWSLVRPDRPEAKP